MAKPQLKKDFWEELDKLLTPTQPPPDAFTAQQFMQRKGLKSSASGTRVLRPLVWAKKLECKQYLVNGKLTNFYSLPK